MAAGPLETAHIRMKREDVICNLVMGRGKLLKIEGVKTPGR
jgi:hypothetical protein